MMRQQQYEHALRLIRKALNEGFERLSDSPSMQDQLEAGEPLSALVANLEKASLIPTNTLDVITKIVNGVLDK